MSGLDVFICIVLLAPLEKLATEAQGKKDLVSVKTPASKCLKCKMHLPSVHTLITASGDEEGSEELDKHRTPLCTASLSAQLHISCFWGSTATPPARWAMGPGAWDATLTMFSALSVSTTEIPCADNLPWWPGDSLESPSKEHQERACLMLLSHTTAVSFRALSC